jgi:hypothetical protein
LYILLSVINIQGSDQWAEQSAGEATSEHLSLHFTLLTRRQSVASSADCLRQFIVSARHTTLYLQGYTNDTPLHLNTHFPTRNLPSILHEDTHFLQDKESKEVTVVEGIPVLLNSNLHKATRYPGNCRILSEATRIMRCFEIHLGYLLLNT